MDPGVTTGVALVLAVDQRITTITLAVTKTFRDYYDWFMQTTQPLPEYEIIVVSEDIVGSGPRDKHIKHAILMEGFAIGLAEAHQGAYTLQQPQLRRAYLDHAKTIAKGKSIHSIDALAHALAYLARHKGVPVDQQIPLPR